jgi:CubicO group peptidase (beta-lactamase class C family)
VKFAAADAAVRGALGTRFTAAVLRIEREGRPVFERAYGSVDDAGGPAIDVAARFDIASITKPFVATAALELVARGVLDLDRKLSGGLIPEWSGTAHDPITLRALLAHTSGMNSGADYRQLLGENVERFALRRPLAAEPGERVIYSDLGFIALATVIERAARTSLRSVMRSEAVRLGCAALDFRPGFRDRAQIPATEDDGWRGRVRGAVHDEKAFLMGGVAGHAGLFATAYDVARLAEAYLAAERGRPTPLDAALAREAIREQAYEPILRRGLGWALKTRDDNSCGALMSPSTFGHTGFVGTCVWADPERDFQVVFLTNAVYFGRKDMRDVRISVYDAATAEFI